MIADGSLVAGGPDPGEAPPPTVRVLVIGETADDSICDVYRTRMYVEPLRNLGVDVRYAHGAMPADRALDVRGYEAAAAASFDALLAEAATADVVVFRRWYATHLACLDCGFATLDPTDAASHARANGHALNVAPDVAVRRLFDHLDARPDAGRGPAIVYETDDDLLRLDATNGQHRRFRHERDLVERMIRRADLVTVSTPVLASRLASLAADVRVVRNAVDPAWYGDPSGAGAGQPVGGMPRICYYGSVGRLREYRTCASAVDAVARTGATRLWFGAPSLELGLRPGSPEFDETHPYVKGVPAFARRLRELEPAIGLAPLIDSPFARAKSELHWLDYSMAGAATVATRLRGPGPYDVIRHGVDGFLVESRTDWQRTLERLVGSPQMRADVAAAARARVLADYAVDRRAPEWADAYRHAARHPGRGRPQVRSAGPGRGRADPVPAGMSGNRAARRGRRGVGVPAEAASRSNPAPTLPVAPTPAEIFAAYVAAQAFAGQSPLRLRLGLGGSGARGAGAGSAKEDGWITVDSADGPDLRHDVRYGLPFADASVDAIEAPEIFEWLDGLAPVLAGEAARVLRCGGILRVTARDRAPALLRLRRLQAEGVDLVGAAGRLPAFTAETLADLLAEAGFAAVERQPAADGVLVVAARR